MSSSRDYWAEREAEQLQHYITDEAEYDKQLRQIYNNMLDGVQQQINAFYGKYAATEGITIAEAKKRVSKLDIAEYERKAKRYVRDRDFSDQANEEMRLYNLTMKVNRLEMLKANIGLELIAGHDELEKFMDGILKGRTEEELQRQAGILGKTVLHNAAKAKAIVNSSFHNARFSDRIWAYQDILRADLNRILQTGLIQGKNPRALAREIREKFNATRYNAERLMRTELARVQTEAQKQSFIRNGFDMYEFICNHHASKHGTCDICQGLDGKHFKVDKMMPGENAPPMHPHCRCSTAAWVDDKDYDAWLDYLANGGTTKEWEKQKNKPAAEPKPATDSKLKVADRISEINDFEGLDEYLKRRYDVGVDKSVKALDFGSVKEALTGVESVLDKAPGLAKILKRVKTSKSGVMSCSGENITFNPFHFELKERIQKACTSQSASGFWVKNASPASIGAHECAHAVEWLMLQKNPAYQYEWQRVDAWNKCTEAKAIVSQACKNIKKTDFGKGQRNFQLISTISRYAGETGSETMAEAFADVYANGADASPLSIEIERLTWEILSSYEGE